jgi:DNA primase
MQDAKEEVRSRLNIEDIIGEYVQLNRAGRNFKGLSPFSGEKTASFYVSPDKHIWHDFSSNKGGDVFSFIMEVEGMDFRESLEHLARRAGVDMSMYDTKGGQEIAKTKKRLLLANELATKYYQQSLISNPHAVEYVFGKRGLSKQIVQDFKIGYAPGTGDALVKFLTKKEFTKKELSQAGLLNQYGGDMFRSRIMIPLMDSVGQVIGFTARIIEDDPKAPKYLNTPQTLLYDKGRHVFGLSQAKEAIRKNDYAVIVEGNLDVVSSHQAGITGVVATAGTAMTENHLRAITRLTSHSRLAFDGDKAGLAATERAIPIAQSVGMDLTIISLPDIAKDPDELIKQDPKLWQSAIDTAQPVVDWVLGQYASREDLTSASGKRSFSSAGLNVIKSLNDVVEKEHYLAKISDYIDTPIEVLKQKLKIDNNSVDKNLKKVVNVKIDIPDTEVHQDNLLAVAIIDIKARELFADKDLSAFVGDERCAVANYLQTHLKVKFEDTPKELQKYDTYVKILLLKADARYAQWNDQDRYLETARLIRQVESEHNKKQKSILTEQLRDAEEIGDNEKAMEVRTRINQLIKEINSGKK